MMYFHALTEGLNDLPGADAAVRAQLQAEKNEYGLAGLYRRLQEVDPITAGRLKPMTASALNALWKSIF